MLRAVHLAGVANEEGGWGCGAHPRQGVGSRRFWTLLGLVAGWANGARSREAGRAADVIHPPLVVIWRGSLSHTWWKSLSHMLEVSHAHV